MYVKFASNGRIKRTCIIKWETAAFRHKKVYVFAVAAVSLCDKGCIWVWSIFHSKSDNSHDNKTIWPVCLFMGCAWLDSCFTLNCGGRHLSIGCFIRHNMLLHFPVQLGTYIWYLEMLPFIIYYTEHDCTCNSLNTDTTQNTQLRRVTRNAKTLNLFDFNIITLIFLIRIGIYRHNNYVTT